MAERAIEAVAAPVGAGKDTAARYPVPPIRGATTRAFLPAIGLTLLVWLVAWPLLTLAFLNRGDRPDVAWIHQLYERKDVALRASSGSGRPRLVVEGGSGALFGVDAELISGRLHIDAINDATHAALGTYFLHRARSILRPGDSVLLCPEYETWWQSDASDIEWGFAVTYDKRFVLQSGLGGGLRSLYSVPWEDYCLSVDGWRGWLKGRPPPTGYGVATLDAVGDLRFAAPLRDFNVPAECGVPGPASPPGAIKAFRDFGDWAKSNRIRVFYSWPNMCRPESAPARRTPPETRELLERDGFILLNAPADTCYPRAWFFDTPYHLDGGGRRVRTEALVRELRPYYGGAARPSEDPQGIYLVGRQTIWLRDGNAFDNHPGVRAKYLVPDAAAAPDAPDAITPDALMALACRGVPVYCDDPSVERMLPQASWEAHEVGHEMASISTWLKLYDRHICVLARDGSLANATRPLTSERIPPDVRDAMNGTAPAAVIWGTGPWRNAHQVMVRQQGVYLDTTVAKLINARVPVLRVTAAARDGRSSIWANGPALAVSEDKQICAAVIDPDKGIVVAAATFPGGGTKTVWSMKQLTPRPQTTSAPVH